MADPDPIPHPQALCHERCPCIRRHVGARVYHVCIIQDDRVVTPHAAPCHPGQLAMMHALRADGGADR